MRFAAVRAMGGIREQVHRYQRSPRMRKNLTVIAAVFLLASPSLGQQQANRPLPGVAATVPAAGDTTQLPPAQPGLSEPAGQPKAPVKTTAASREAAPELTELSPWPMFLAADAVVKAVMISLAFASIVTWTILLAKSVSFNIARRRLEKSLLRISACRTLPEAELALGPKTDVLGSFLFAAAEETRLSGHASSGSGIKERAASRFSEIVRVETRAVRHGMAVLATIGATAPFIGLFGTVWGIMDSFIGISKSQTTNLAVVAPGIAEALLATAFGLGAAIPAVIFYNYLSRTMRGYLDLVGRASGATGRLLSRTLEQSEAHTDARAAE